jgi:inosine-uridine nucleoside N-ribohydrolase
MPTRVILDTDPGIDDALAILLALSSPEVELSGLSVTGGNCSLADCVRNALSVLALGGHPDIPVHAGVGLPLIRPPYTAPESHGDAGLGYARLPSSRTPPASEHAVDMLIREIMAAPGEITLVAIAPLTNVAIAVRKEPRIVQAVREVIIMGGALSVEGNSTPLAEFNFFVDPHAAHIVLHSGMPITLIPWDITRDVLLTQAHIKRLLQIDSPISRFIEEATRYYIEFHEAYFGYPGCSINDPAALALAFLPDLARTKLIHIDVEIASELTIAKTVADFLGARGLEPNVRAVLEFDTARFLALFVERMEKLARERPTASRRG